MRVTILGAGKMGRGIATRAIAGGHEVEVIDGTADVARSLADDLGARATVGTAVTGEMVVMALAYEAIPGAIEQHRDALAGKTVVDIANPVDRATMDRVVTPATSSSAEETATLLPPSSSVVKAFNTTLAKTLIAGQVAGQPLDVLIAGDDPDAKKKVSALVEAGGMRAIDVGPLARARMLEQVGMFQIAIQGQIGAGFASALKLFW